MYPTTYAKAVDWMGGGLILCNNIPEVDKCLFEETIGYPITIEDQDEEEEDCYPDIYQYYLTPWDESQCSFLNEHFGLMFAYSEKLDLFVLLVDHCGTSWNYVRLKTDLPQAEAELGEM